MIQSAGLLQGANPQILQSYQANDSRPGKESGQAGVSQRVVAANDKVTLTYSASESALTYTSAMTLQGGKNDGYDLLRGLVMNILEEQGVDLKIATDTGEIDLESLSQEDAQALIAEDGYFGVEQTSDRIVHLAIGIAGGDVSRLDAIKEGVAQGFQEALDAFGGWLPDLSYETYDAVMAKLDEWAGVTAESQQS
jgi:hypothetical protein